MFAVFWDPAQIQNEFTFDFSLCGKGLISLNSERSENDVTLLIASASLDEESTVLKCTVDCDFFAFPVIGFVVVEFVKEICGGLLVWDSVNELSLSLIILWSNKVLEVVIYSSDDACQSQGNKWLWGPSAKGRYYLWFFGNLIS